MRADPAQGLLSYGPIKIEMPSRPHSSKLVVSCFLGAVLMHSNMSADTPAGSLLIMAALGFMLPLWLGGGDKVGLSLLHPAALITHLLI